MNGHNNTNGISHGKSPQPPANGNVSFSKGSSAPLASAKALDQCVTATTINGITQPVQSVSSSSQLSLIKMDELPEEILEMLQRIPEDAYVPTSRLVERAAQECWTDLIVLLNDLAQIQTSDDMRSDPETRMLQERLKKQKLWDFAENHKKVLIKLLVILQWSPQSMENRLTIALNHYLHQLRVSFNAANENLFSWINYIVTRHDPAPDLDTAMKVLSTGRIEDLPDFGYAQQKDLPDRQILATIRRLNSILQVRMMSEESIPPPLSNWQVRDGRVTFRVPDEFDLAVSVMAEELDAKFLMVDVSFNFKPAPSVSRDLLDQITNIVNAELAAKGLIGAYRFLHELALSQKLEELHVQARKLAQGLWAGHLSVEFIKRTLVVKYWTRSSSNASWIEIVLNSGRSNSGDFSTPFIGLRWSRNRTLVTDHNIELNLVNLSFESVLNQVIAQHTSSIFDGIYDRLSSSKIFAENDLELDQSSSLRDVFECSLDIELSKMDNLHVTCDPVSGNIVLSPASDPANRFQQEVARSKNIVGDFAHRFPALRCSLTQARLVSAVQNTSLQVLSGRKPNYSQVKELFGPTALRALFFKRRDWSSDWALAASFGTEGGTWWLVFDPSMGERSVQQLRRGPIHLQTSLHFSYFEALANDAETNIYAQTSQQAAERAGMRTLLPGGTVKHPALKVRLSNDEYRESIGQDIVMAPYSSKRASSNHNSIVLAQLKASRDAQQVLALAELDSSITVQPNKRLLTLRLSCAVGENKMPEILARLRSIDDLISCIKLVHRRPHLKMDRLSLEEIIISYHTGTATSLSLALPLQTSRNASRLELLPKDSNPHHLVSRYIQPMFGDGLIPLSKRLQKLLAILRMTLPLVNTLQFLQGNVNSQVVPEMALLDMEESRKWLRMHIIVRDMVRFGIHFSAVNPAFKKDMLLEETPQNMLVRLEILPEVGDNGKRLRWILRPAIEEFKTYLRPSFTNQALKQRLKERIFAVTDAEGWLGMDMSACCLIADPYRLIIAVHDAILQWLKQDIAKQAEAPKQPVPIKQENVAPPTTSKQPQPRPPTQQASTNFQQARPQNMQQIPNGTSRVMTAPPQQVRQPPPNAQRRGNQMNQNQNRNNQQRPQIPNPNDVINLD